MGTAGLDRAIRKGVPLLEVVVRLIPDIDYNAATERMNSMADDFDLTPKPWRGDLQLRVGAATKEALERLFGWKFKRVPMQVFHPQEETQTRSDKMFKWREVSPLSFFPDVAKQSIKAIWIEQPGADDNGQWYE